MMMKTILVCALVLISLPSFSGGAPAGAKLVTTGGCEGAKEPEAACGGGSEEGEGEGVMVEGEIYAELGEQRKVTYQGTKMIYDY